VKVLVNEFFEFFDTDRQTYSAPRYYITGEDLVGLRTAAREKEAGKDP